MTTIIVSDWSVKISKAKHTYSQYPPEFKQEIVNLVLEQDYTDPEAAKCFQHHDHTVLQMESEDWSRAQWWGLSWEPLGSGWPLNRLKDLEQALTDAARARVELAAVDSEKVNLVARVYEFEQRYRNKNYAGAVNVLSILLKHYEETFIQEPTAAEQPE